MVDRRLEERKGQRPTRRRTSQFGPVPSPRQLPRSLLPIKGRAGDEEVVGEFGVDSGHDVSDARPGLGGGSVFGGAAGEVGPCAENSAALCGLGVFVEEAAESVSADDLDVVVGRVG